jgi:hypothetical protein
MSDVCAVCLSSSVWGKNCVENHSGKSEPIKCPLCRTSWGMSSLDDLRVHLGLQKNKVVKRPTILCTSCQQPITHLRYRCLTCPSYDSCGVCYRRQRHPATHAMVLRMDGSSDWRPAPYIDKDAISRRHLELLRELQHRELTYDDYDFLLTLDKHNANAKLHDYMVATLPRYEPPTLMLQLQSSQLFKPPPLPTCCFCDMNSHKEITEQFQVWHVGAFGRAMESA